MDAELTRRLRDEARRLGFDAVGIAPAVPSADHPRFLEWLGAGHGAGMSYLGRHAALRENPANLLQGARSLVVVALLYHAPPNEAPPATRGKVARYAQGADYHGVVWGRLGQLLDWLRAERPGIQGRALCDTAPVLERDVARLAGLGWIGKNTMLIHKRLGSYTLLGTLIVDIELEPDVPSVSSHCGTCTRCLDACPTGAFVAPHVLDARRCISYWTIEHRGPIAPEFADRLEGWVFGCDICQEVCPWNRKAPPGTTAELEPRAELQLPDLLDWLDAEPDEFTRAIRGTALSRAKRSGLLRNAAHVLGSRRVAEAVAALRRRLDDVDPVVREAAAWALRQIDTPEARSVLEGSEKSSS